MYVFEAVSLTINILLFIILLLKGKNIKNNTSNKVIDVVLWTFVILFLLNTVGNLMAETLFDKIVFTSLTLLFAVLIL